MKRIMSLKIYWQLARFSDITLTWFTSRGVGNGSNLLGLIAIVKLGRKREGEGGWWGMFSLLQRAVHNEGLGTALALIGKCESSNVAGDRDASKLSELVTKPSPNSRPMISCLPGLHVLIFDDNLYAPATVSVLSLYNWARQCQQIQVI